VAHLFHHNLLVLGGWNNNPSVVSITTYEIEQSTAENEALDVTTFLLASSTYFHI